MPKHLVLGASAIGIQVVMVPIAESSATGGMSVAVCVAPPPNATILCVVLHVYSPASLAIRWISSSVVLSISTWYGRKNLGS
jgi:hypothetical protein